MGEKELETRVYPFNREHLIGLGIKLEKDEDIGIEIAAKNFKDIKILRLVIKQNGKPTVKYRSIQSKLIGEK